MTTSAQEWADLVQQAAVDKDAAALRALFVEAQVIFGAEAGHRWAEALSAFDATAVTG